MDPAENKKENLIVLTGPTAAGKSELSVQLAKRIGGEIISADSMQVYRGMDIGSAKITVQEMQGVPHHLIDVLDPSEPFDVVRFQSLAKEAMRQIRSRGRIPILVGGTGFYIQAVLYDVDFTRQEQDSDYRRMLEQKADPQQLHRMLEEADPEAARQIHPNNIKRTIRALEYYRETGRRISEHNEAERAKESPYRFAYFVLHEDREVLYDRINRRVDRMMEEGLEEEVRLLKERGMTRDMVSMQGIGYAEMLQYLDGEIPLEEALRLIRRNTRHFAKRQLTWFRRERDVTWIDRGHFNGDNDRILDEMLRVLSERDILRQGYIKEKDMQEI